MYSNPDPPVEFFARGLDLDVPWVGGGTLRVTGNSFATRTSPGSAPLILSKHPATQPFELKTVLRLDLVERGGEPVTAMRTICARRSRRECSAPRSRTARCFARSSRRRGRSSPRKAASIFLLDEETDELVFEAVAGEGEDDLVGMRLPSGTGIAGWVVSSRQPLVIEDVSGDPRFGREVAEATGYMPKGLMAVAAAPRGTRARRARGARPSAALTLQPRRDGAARAVRRAGGDRPRPAAAGADGAGGAGRGRRGSRASSPGSRQALRHARGPAGASAGLRLLAALDEVLRP